MTAVRLPLALHLTGRVLYEGAWGGVTEHCTLIGHGSLTVNTVTQSEQLVVTPPIPYLQWCRASSPHLGMDFY